MKKEILEWSVLLLIFAGIVVIGCFPQIVGL